MTEIRTVFDWLRLRVNHEGDECLMWPYGRDDKGYGQVTAFDRIRKPPLPHSQERSDEEPIQDRHPPRI